MTTLDLSVCCLGDTLCVLGTFLMGLQWWNAKGLAHGCSDRVDVTQGQRGKAYVPGQEHWTEPALLSYLSHNLKLSHPLLGPLWTHLSNRDSPLPAITCSDRLWGAVDSRQPCGPRERHSKGHQPLLVTGPKSASLPFPWEGDHGMGAGGSPLQTRAHQQTL